MDFTRRYLFHGSASALGGRIVRHEDKPIDLVIDGGCESSLTSVGGRSHNTISGKNYQDLVGFGAASTSAEGLFDDHAQAIEASYGRVPEDSLVATTKVTAEIHDVVVGKSPRLTVKRLAATLHSRSPYGSGLPSITHGDQTDGTAIDGVSIDGHELNVELNLSLLNEYDTHAKLLCAADDPAFVRNHGHCFYMTSGVDSRRTPARGRLVMSHGGIHGSIVTNMQWKGTPFPGATIDHNALVVPGFGRIFFGEVLISDRSRRLTMMRVKMGSPTGGQVAFAATDPNGAWS